jgi:transposase
MPVYMLLTDAVWAAIEPMLTSINNNAGSPPELSDRQFMEAVWYFARPGLPWRDLPDEFGYWDAVYNRIRQWEARGIWRQLWERFQPEGCEGATHVFIDSTIVCSPACRGGPNKHGGHA